MEKGNTIVMGKISGVHGLKGALKLHVYAEAPETIFVKGRQVEIQNARVHERYMVHSLVPHGNGFLLFLKEITTRTDAESLIGGKIEISRSDLPVLTEENTYYWHDLIGLTVVTDTDEELGKIDHIIETGSNDVYVVQAGKREVLLPAIESVILSVDLENGRMIVSIPPGLIEELP